MSSNLSVISLQFIISIGKTCQNPSGCYQSILDMLLELCLKITFDDLHGYFELGDHKPDAEETYPIVMENLDTPFDE